MTYELGQIVAWLFVAAASGAVLFALGGVIWRRWRVGPVRALEIELEAMHEHDQRQREDVAALRRALSESERQRADLDRSRRQLTAALDARNRNLNLLQRRVHSDAAQPDDYSETKVADLQRDCDALREQLVTYASSEARLSAEVNALVAINRNQETRVHRLKSQLEELQYHAAITRESRPPAWVIAAPIGPKDQLQRVQGIDAGLERALNQLGIYHFHQIARFNDDDIRWVADRLDWIVGNIIDENWVGQAAALAREPAVALAAS